MKNKTLNSIIFIIITIGVLLFLDLYVFPSTANLYSSDGWSYSDNYTFLLIKYLFLILITIIIQIFNITILPHIPFFPYLLIGSNATHAKTIALTGIRDQV